MNIPRIHSAEHQGVRILAVILLLLVLSWAWLNGIFRFGEHCGRTLGQGCSGVSAHSAFQ